MWQAIEKGFHTWENGDSSPTSTPQPWKVLETPQGAQWPGWGQSWGPGFLPAIQEGGIRGLQAPSPFAQAL